MVPVDYSELDYASVRHVDELGRAFRKGAPAEDLLRAVLASLDRVEPEAVARVDGRLRRLLGYWRAEPTTGWLQRAADDRSFGLKLLESVDGLEILFLSHPDGWLREQALRKLDGGLPSPYAFAIAALRLNDWAAPVRRAAESCVLRTYPQTQPAIVARAALHVIASSQSWRRWTVEGRALETALTACAASDAVIGSVLEARTGPVCAMLRKALVEPAYDHGLIDIAGRARIPQVRALALRTLINGRATWISGYEPRWTDKSMGEYRRGPVFAHRPLNDPPDRGRMIAMGARDAFAAVRRAAADGLATHWRELEDVEGLVGLFRPDDRAPVRERIDFVRRRLAERDQSIGRDAAVGPG